MWCVTTAATTFLEGILPMRFVSTLVAVAALSLVGASSPGAITSTKPPVPAVLPATTAWRAWVTVVIGGKSYSGFADWVGTPDVVPLGAPSTWVFVGSGTQWRRLTAKEQAAVVVIIRQIEMGYGVGPYQPGTTVGGF